MTAASKTKVPGESCKVDLSIKWPSMWMSLIPSRGTILLLCIPCYKQSLNWSVIATIPASRRKALRCLSLSFLFLGSVTWAPILWDHWSFTEAFIAVEMTFNPLNNHPTSFFSCCFGLTFIFKTPKPSSTVSRPALLKWVPFTRKQ